MREYVSVVRAALSNEVVTHEGPRYPVEGAPMSFAPLRANLPIYLAALGPRMTALAGEIADGVFVHMRGPEDLIGVRANIAIGCERGDRDPSEIQLTVLAILCVDDDVDAARVSVREAIADYLGYDSYRRHVTRLGYARALHQMETSLGRGDVQEAARYVPDELVDRVTIYGPLEDCKSRLLEYSLAGADVTVLSPRPLAHLARGNTHPMVWEKLYTQIITQLRRSE